MTRTLNSIERAEIERHIRYITDDGTIAAYHNIPRGIVAMIRAKMHRPRQSTHSLPPKADDFGNVELNNRKTEAQIANEGHVAALKAYAAKYHPGVEL